jgi:hypothetical protein
MGRLRLAVPLLGAALALSDSGCAQLLDLQDRSVGGGDDATAPDGPLEDVATRSDAAGAGTDGSAATDAASSTDAAGASVDGAVSADAAPGTDAGGAGVDAPTATDAARSADAAGAGADAPTATDAARSADAAGAGVDATVSTDAAPTTDAAGAGADATVSTDAAPTTDAAGAGADATVSTDAAGDSGAALDSNADSPEATLPDACGDPCDMADGLDNPIVIVSDAYNVYWVEPGDDPGSGNGSIKSCSVDGCQGSPDVWQTNLMNPCGIAFDSFNVYWATTTDGASVTGGIWSCPIAGHADGCMKGPSQLAHATAPFGIAVDDSYVYWADSNLYALYRVSISNPGTAELVYGDPDGGPYVFASPPIRCAVAGTRLWVIDDGANVYSLPKAGGTPKLVRTATGNPMVAAGLTVEPSGTAYFGQLGQILSATASGSSKVLVSSSDSLKVYQPMGLIVDVTAPSPGQEMLYWADYGDGMHLTGAIGRVGVDGANPTLLKSSLVTPVSVTLSGNYVFWLSAGDLVSTSSPNTSYTKPNTGRLWRTAK